MSDIQEIDCCETEIYGEIGEVEFEPECDDECDDECEGCDACDAVEQAAYDAFVAMSTKSVNC